jgi:hypothetical protein
MGIMCGMLRGIAGVAVLLGAWSTAHRAVAHGVVNPAEEVVGTAHPTSHPTAHPTTQRAVAHGVDGRAPAAFQPGVAIDWATRTVHVEAHVVLRAGPLEFLACFPGKEHESIVCCDAAATHVFMALGLVGLTPGAPSRWDEAAGRSSDPTGDLVDIRLAWEADGQRREVDGFDWLVERSSGRPPVARPWVFTGSLERAGGGLVADVSGAGVALVEMPDALLAQSRRHSSHNDELWAEARTAAVPAAGTRVTVLLRPAAAREYAVRLDFRGTLWVDGRAVSQADLADLVRVARRQRADYVQVVTVERALRADEARVVAALAALDLPAGAVRFVRP